MKFMREVCAALLLLAPVAAAAGDDKDKIWPVTEKPSWSHRHHRDHPARAHKYRADDPGQPIPEPSSLIVFATGMLIAARSRRARPAIAK